MEFVVDDWTIMESAAVNPHKAFLRGFTAILLHQFDPGVIRMKNIFARQSGTHMAMDPRKVSLCALEHPVAHVLPRDPDAVHPVKVTINPGQGHGIGILAVYDAGYQLWGSEASGNRQIGHIGTNKGDFISFALSLFAGTAGIKMTPMLLNLKVGRKKLQGSRDFDFHIMEGTVTNWTDLLLHRKHMLNHRDRQILKVLITLALCLGFFGVFTVASELSSGAPNTFTIIVIFLEN